LPGALLTPLDGGNANRGQQAMLVALGLRKMRSAVQAQKETGIDNQRISRARFVIENAPDQVDLVLAGNSRRWYSWFKCLRGPDPARSLVNALRKR
jgi:hypothetical protein